MIEALDAGVARSDIRHLPASGCALYRARGASSSVHQPLTATSLVLRSGGAKVAILALDLTVVSLAGGVRRGESNPSLRTGCLNARSSNRP